MPYRNVFCLLFLCFRKKRTHDKELLLIFLDPYEKHIGEILEWCSFLDLTVRGSKLDSVYAELKTELQNEATEEEQACNSRPFTSVHPPVLGV